MQADLTGYHVIRPKEQETTALGAAFAAGVTMRNEGVDAEQVGVFGDMNKFKEHWEVDKEFKPRLSEQRRKELYREWLRAVDRARNWMVDE